MAHSVEITCIVEPNFGENAFVVWCEDGGPCWIIDPGFPPSAANAIEHIREHNLTLEAIFLTHGHLDHIAGLTDLQETHADVPIYIAKEEAAALTDPNENLSAPFGAPLVLGDIPTQDLAVGHQFKLGPTSWQVLDTSGHSPGGRSLYCEEGIVLVGDALFQGSIGRTDFHHSNPDDLISNIRTNLFALSDDTKVYSGHGPVTTIGIEKRSNPFVGG